MTAKENSVAKRVTNGWLGICLGAICVFGVGGLNRAAAEPIWLNAAYPYIVVEHKLKDVLLDFGGNVGVPVKVSDQVSGWVRSSASAGNGRDFLDRLADTHRFEWYFDGKQLHVTASNEATERVLSLRGVRTEAIEKSLLSLGIADARYPLRVSLERGIAIVAGPPRYVTLVETAIASLKPKPRRKVEIIRGRGS